MKGFGIRIGPSGRRKFVFQYDDAAARTRRVSLGEFGALTVEQARELAKQHAAAVAKARTDPDALDPARAREEAKRGARIAGDMPTMSDLFDAFLADRERRADPSTLNEYRRMLGITEVKRGPRKGEPRPGVLRVAFGAKRVTAVARQDIRDFHAAHAPKPAAANRFVVVLSAVFNFALQSDLIPNLPNPCDGVRLYKLKPRRQSLRDEDYERLGTALDAAVTAGLLTPPSRRNRRSGLSRKRREKLTGRTRGQYAPKAAQRSVRNPNAVAMLRFLALSGWRSKEAKLLRWEHIDFTRGVAILPDSKTGRTVRPLGCDTLEMLSALRERPDFDGANPFVFPGTKPNAPLVEIDHVWAAVRHAAGLDATLHGLRHAFVTTARWLGYGDHVIARLVGHENSASQTSRYGDVPDRQVARAGDEIARYIARRLRGVPVDQLTESAA